MKHGQTLCFLKETDNQQHKPYRFLKGLWTWTFWTWTLRLHVQSQDHTLLTQPRMPSQHAPWSTVGVKYFCMFLYIYIHRVFNFKMCCSFSKCQTFNKYPPVPVTLCCLCCPLRLLWLDRPCPAEGDIWRCPHRGFGGTCPAKLILQKGRSLGPWHREGRKMVSHLETRSLFSPRRYGYSDPWALF